jgi:CubicO group peptidase (beta-lactamase class C family)
MTLRWLTCLALTLLPLDALALTPEQAALRQQADAILAAETVTQAPGAGVLIAQDENVLYRAARGRASLALDVALSPDQVFRIGSLTKTFTAAAILKLSAAGKLSIQDPLAKFLPDYPGGGTISLAQLLGHTAGISDAWEVDATKPHSTGALVKLIAAQAPDFAPGTAWAYSNSGYMLLGAVLEKVTGQPWHLALQSLLTKPLGLTQTAFHPDDEIVPGSVVGYSQNERGEPILAPYVSATGPGAAGALSSTVDDMFHFLHALTTGRALPPKLYEAMSSAKTTATGKPTSYGYGLMLGTVRGEPVVEHNGGVEGFASQMTYFPKQHVTVIVLANTDAGAPSPRSLAHRLGAVAIGKPYPALVPIKAAARLTQELCGSYRIDASSKRTLSVEADVLLVQREGGPKRPLAISSGEKLFFPHDGTDYFQVVRDTRGKVIALDFYPDGSAPARRETRIP